MNEANSPHWTTKRKINWQRGQRVCIIGHGTANGVHSHQWTVDRVTAKQVVISRPHPRPRTEGERIVERFWRETGRNVGSANEWGWRSISDRCQEPPKAIPINPEDNK